MGSNKLLWLKVFLPLAALLLNACSGPGTVQQSGATWTAQTSGTTNDLIGVTYGNGIFVAVGLNGTLLTSPDGVEWTGRYSDSDLKGITYGNGTFVAVGQNGTILTSP
ncbi:MAG: hypothetical protein C4327_07400 [Meiothermus sp.]